MQSPAAMADVRVRAGTDHACHFYDDDTGLSTTVAAFLGPAFANGHAVISIGTRAHIAAIEQRLRTDGHDVDAARGRGQYLTLDAERAVPLLLRNGLPTANTFHDVVGVHVERLAGAHGNVRAFGEVVNVLWRQGRRAAALRLEDLWNEALGYHPLSLVCGYSMRSFRDPSEAAGVNGILSVHTNVIPTRAS
jgi:hypothetical protein